MRRFIDIASALFENARDERLADLARKHDSVEAFIHATDGEEVLYRGHRDDETQNNSFMTDYVGHAETYADEGRIDAFAYSPEDVLYFNDERFEEMRRTLDRLDDDELAQAYQEALQGNRFAHEFALDAVKEIVRGREIEDDWGREDWEYTPYSEIAGNPELNDAFVPLMQKWAREKHGKNIIAFHGNDYAGFGGQTEYVVGDVSQLTDLRKLYAAVHGG